jgi:hypothetical protein
MTGLFSCRVPGRIFAWPLAVFAALTLGACQRHDHDHGHDHAGHDHEHGAEAGSSAQAGHVHVAPRGGRLVVLAEEFAHLEVLYSAADGRLDVYALDAHAEQPVRLTASQLPVTLTPANGPALELLLTPVASSLTGETVGDSSHFQVTDERLKGLSGGQALLTEITSRGQTFKGVGFPFP